MTFTQILFIIVGFALLLLIGVLIFMLIVKGIAKSKKFVQLTLTKVLREKCEGKPNKTFCLQDKEGNILTVKYLPKVVK